MRPLNMINNQEHAAMTHIGPSKSSYRGTVFSRAMKPLCMTAYLAIACCAAHAYDAPEHSSIGQNIRSYLDSYLISHGGAGEDFNSKGYANILLWEVEEDNLPFSDIKDPSPPYYGLWATYYEHFWNPHSNPEGLSILGKTFHSADYRAGRIYDCLWGYVTKRTGNNRVKIQECLGRLAHLVGDMGVPAHVLCDPHPCYDRFEKTMSRNQSGAYKIIASELDEALMSGVPEVCMRDLLDRTNVFPSDGYTSHTGITSDTFWVREMTPTPCSWADGSYYNVRRATAVKDISNVAVMMTTCYKGAQRSVYGYLIGAYKEICPNCFAGMGPGSTAQNRGGSTGHLTVTSNRPIKRVEIKYTRQSTKPVDGVANGSWYSVQQYDYVPIGGNIDFRFPDETHGKIWLRVKVWDNNELDSAGSIVGPYYLDSRGPEVVSAEKSTL